MLPNTHRIESLDLLRGVVMVIMALDHVRDYFHFGSFSIDPTDLQTTTPLLFFTRIITHFCAPVFVFLAGTSAFLFGQNKSKQELFKFLFTRGIWLIFLELVVNNFIWTFDPTYSFMFVQVIWAIGFSLLVLSVLIFLPKKIILILGALLVLAHNLLDGIVFEDKSISSIIWYLLHQQQLLFYSKEFIFSIQYPLIPWIGLMALGYCFGQLYDEDFEPRVRKKYLLILGLSISAVFILLRWSNIYGDLYPWTHQDSQIKTLMSFLNVTKYPPSLLYICFTMGPAFLFLYFFENLKNLVTEFFIVFGRVPLFYYFLHVLVIHCVAIIGIEINGGNGDIMILDADSFFEDPLRTYGYSLGVVYLVWIGIVAFLYPICRFYMQYKAENKNKKWLSYL